MPTSKHVAGIAITVLLAAVAAGSPAVTAQNVAARGADRGAATQPRAVTGSASSLAAIAAIPHAGGAWAVGEQCGGSNRCPAGGRALVLRLRGSRWSRVSVPSPGGAVLLTGIGASSSSNAWAVGSYDGSQNLNLFLHWNGKRWRQVRGPSQPEGALSGVSVTSADDAWAVGTYQSPSTLADVTLVLHWNGRKWARVPTPDPGSGGNQLLGVAALSRTDAWAVGASLSSSTSEYQTLILHWNGRKWSRARAPAVSTLGTQLAGVAAVSGSDAWAVGRFDNASNFDNPLILHWNGRSWGRARAPARASSLEELFAVSAWSATRAWAVGIGPCVGGGVDCPSHSLTLRWNGTRWAAVSSPSVSDSGDQNILTGVAAMSGAAAWAAGSYYPAAAGHPRPGAAAALDRDDLAQGLTPPTVSGLPAGFAALCEALGWERQASAATPCNHLPVPLEGQLAGATPSPWTAGPRRVHAETAAPVTGMWVLAVDGCLAAAESCAAGVSAECRHTRNQCHEPAALGGPEPFSMRHFVRHARADPYPIRRRTGPGSTRVVLSPACQLRTNTPGGRTMTPPLEPLPEGHTMTAETEASPPTGTGRHSCLDQGPRPGKAVRV